MSSECRKLCYHPAKMDMPESSKVSSGTGSAVADAGAEDGLRIGEPTLPKLPAPAGSRREQSSTEGDYAPSG